MSMKKMTYSMVLNALINLIIPLLFIVIAYLVTRIILGNQGYSQIYSLVISLLLGIMLNQFIQNFVNSNNNTKSQEVHSILAENTAEMAQLSILRRKINEIGHPYFTELSESHYESFFAEYKKLSEGIYHTASNAEDIFMPTELIKYINTGTHIRATSMPRNYSDIIFAKKYFVLQKDMIKNKKVTITRIFIFSDENEKMQYIDEMKKQFDIGVKVFFIYANNKFVNKDWLKEDYMIQGDIEGDKLKDKILIQFICSHNNDSPEGHQIITTDQAEIKVKAKRFSILEQKATLYDPKDEVVLQIENNTSTT